MVKKYQRFMGTVFTGMGLACLMFPSTVLRLSIPVDRWTSIITINQVDPIVKLLMQCFGSQAVLSGILILSSEFTESTFAIFGTSMIPFFVFDCLAWSGGLLTSFGAVGDAVGNIIFSVCSYYGYKGLKAKKK